MKARVGRVDAREMYWTTKDLEDTLNVSTSDTKDTRESMEI